MNICIDVGGTKTLVALFDENGEMGSSAKFPTPHNVEDFFTQLFIAIEDLKPENVSSIGVAMPGLIDRENGIALSFGNLPWENVAVRDRLQAVYDVPVFIDNDANLAGLAEAQELDPEEYPLVLYITVSTGIGSGAIYKHHIHADLADTEAGAMHFIHDGRITKWEHYASGKAIKAQYGKLASEIDDPEIWKDIANNLAIGFSNMVAMLQPHAIVVGGGVGTHLDKFKEPLVARMLQIAENSRTLRHNQPPIFKAQHPEQAVVYGCHLLCEQNKDDQ